MKRTLRVLALMIVLAAAGYWIAAGANRGWTKNRVQIKSVDSVTGLEDIRWQEKYVPGVDFLGVAALGAGLLAGLSFLFRSRNHRR